MVSRANSSRSVSTIVLLLTSFSVFTNQANGETVPKELTNSLGMKLVLIPAGSFEMGGSEEDDEKPVHTVRITQPFYLGTHEVTRGAFRQFVESTGHRMEGEAYGWNSAKNNWEKDAKYSWKNPGFSQTDDHPVVCVSWEDATAFCTWLSRKEGRKYRLPTEAEWEYACRAGTKSKWSFGDSEESLARYGNIADSRTSFSYKSSWDDGFAFTAPVGKFRANAWGLHDMHGNVWEWCEDWYDEDYYSQSPSDDPLGPAEGVFRVLRGGSCSVGPVYARSALRFRIVPGYRSYYLGFRVLLSSVQ